MCGFPIEDFAKLSSLVSIQMQVIVLGVFRTLKIKNDLFLYQQLHDYRPSIDSPNDNMSSDVSRNTWRNFVQSVLSDISYWRDLSDEIDRLLYLFILFG